MKHILVISQYFYPENFRINDIAAEWVKRGYKVTVLTGIPNYPMGHFYDGYDYKHKRTEKWKGIDIIRIPLIPRGNSSNKIINALGMVANYFSFVISGRRWVKKNNIRADLVFTFEVSPMTQALIGIWYGKKYKVPTFLYVQDLWPENVETVTGIHSRLVLGPIDKMVDKIYRETDHIFTTSPSFVDTICNRKITVARKKVHYWPQYAEEFYKPVAKQVAKQEAVKYGIPNDDSFKIIFTGNIGTAQGLQILPKTAELLRGRNIKFVMVGDGRYLKKFNEEVDKRNLKHMFIMIPRQNSEVIPVLLAACDAAFLSFADNALWTKTIPAKLQSYMACGMPIIASAQGETARIVGEANCGVIADIGVPKKLFRKIEEIMKCDLEEMGKKSRIYFEKNYDKQILMNQIDRYFEKKV